MKRLLLTVFSLFAVNTIIQAEEPDPLSFFPHQVGDTWVYKYYTGSVSRLFITKSWVNNDTTFLAYNEGDTPSYFTYKNDVYYAAIDKRGNWLYYKLDAKKNDQWMVLPAGPKQSDLRWDAVVDDVYTTFLFGKDVTVKQISYYKILPGSNSIEEGSMYVYTQWLASGIGVFQEIGEGRTEMEYVLTGYIINGDTIGVTTGINDEQLPAPITAQAFPNPCFNSTTIRYSLPTGITGITLSVCDYTGTEILHQYITDFPVTLNTTTLSSGTYWCTIIAGRHTVTVPIVVLR